jgi:hypothetical protein
MMDDITRDQRVEMGRMVREFFNDPGKTDAWWTTPNPMLGGVKPYQMSLMGRERALYNFIKTSIEEGGPIAPAGSAT